MHFWIIIFIAITVTVILFFVMDLARLVGILQNSLQDQLHRIDEHLSSQAKNPSNNSQQEEEMTDLHSNNVGPFQQSSPCVGFASSAHQRKSLSSVYKEKKLENGSPPIDNGFLVSNGISAASIIPDIKRAHSIAGVDINANSTYDSVFRGDGPIDESLTVEHFGIVYETPKINGTRFNAADQQPVPRNLITEFSSPYSSKISKAAKPNELEVQESRRRILEQVKKARQDKDSYRTYSVDCQSSPFDAADKKPLRSILKKKTMSTSEPTLNSELSPTASKVVTTTTHTVRVTKSSDDQNGNVVTSSSIELRHPSPREAADKKSPNVKAGTLGSRSSVSGETTRTILPDVVRDPSKGSISDQSPIKSPKSPMNESYSRKSPFLENEHDDYREWDPKRLLDELYDVDYTPRVEEKKRQYNNFVGHLDHLPLGLRVAVADSLWRTHYFKTKDGSLIWLENPNDVISYGDVVLAGTELDVDKNENTILIHGGKDGIILKLRCLPEQMDNVRLALLSHGAGAVSKNYVNAVYPPIPTPDDNVCVIELGSSSIRAGVLTTEPSLPQIFFPTIATVVDNEVYVGSEALSPEIRHRGTFIQPIRPTNHTSTNRYNVDLNIMRHVFKKVFVDLKISSENYEIMLSLPQNAPVNMISDLMKILLNEFKVRGVAVAKQPFLILYSYDVTTGVVLDIGDHLNIVPVIDGYVVQNAIVSLPYGGGKLAEELRLKLTEQHPDVSFMAPVERYVLRYILERSCYVAEDFDEEVGKYEQTPEVIDTVIKLNKFDIRSESFDEFRMDSTRFTCTEGLFKPKRWSLDVEGIQKLVFHAIQSTPMDSRRVLYKNIYLAGGTSLLPGFAQRLESELTKLAPSTVQVCVHASPWRYHSAYVGAQVLAGASQFEQTLITSAKLDMFIRQMHSANF